MPIHYRVEHDQQLIVTHVEGSLSAQDLMGYFESIHPYRAINHFDRLIVLKDLTSVMPDRETRAMARYAQLSAGANTEYRTALVAENLKAQEFSIRYQRYRNPQAGKFFIFNNIDDALEWLCLDQDPVTGEFTEVDALEDDFLATRLPTIEMHLA